MDSDDEQIMHEPTMAEETPERPTTQKKKISAEHLAKMRAGRQRWLDAKNQQKQTEIDNSNSIISILEEQDAPKTRAAPRRKRAPTKKKQVVNNYYYEDESSEEDEPVVVNNHYKKAPRRRKPAKQPKPQPIYEEAEQMEEQELSDDEGWDDSDIVFR